MSIQLLQTATSIIFVASWLLICHIIIRTNDRKPAQPDRAPLRGPKFLTARRSKLRRRERRSANVHGLSARE
jgi:hypothetical protein